MADNGRRNGRAKVANPYVFDEYQPSLSSLKKWYNRTENYMKQNEENLQFFDDEEHSAWTAKSVDPTRGLIIHPRAGQLAIVANPDEDILAQPAVEERTADEATRLTRILRRDLETLLNNYAAYCPDGFLDLIVEDCTSIKWIFERLAASYKLESTKQYFLNSHLIQYRPNDGDTPEKLYIRLRAHYKAAAPKRGNNFDGRVLQEDVRLNELSELMLVEKVLERVDPRLPAHVMKTRGHLMQDEEKTLFCIRRLLWDQLDTMVQEMDQGEHLASMVTTRNITSGTRRNDRYKSKQGFPSKNRGSKSSNKSFRSNPKGAADREKMYGACFRAGRQQHVYSSHNIDTCTFLSSSDKRSLVRAIASWTESKAVSYTHLTLPTKRIV